MVFAVNLADNLARGLNLLGGSLQSRACPALELSSW